MSSIRFGEVMVGSVTPWSRDTAKGYGGDGAFTASLRAQVDIDDLDLFTDRDLPHRSGLSVELDIPFLSGRPFVTYDGSFELFRRGDIPSHGRGMLMVYDGFLTDGRRVLMLKGRKYLKPGQVLKVWPQTTTMRVILRDVTHGGRVDAEDIEPFSQRDFGRPKFLSGTVRLTPSAFMKQMTSMNATDAPWLKQPFVVLRFMSFFVASLVRIYVFRSRR